MNIIFYILFNVNSGLAYRFLTVTDPPTDRTTNGLNTKMSIRNYVPKQKDVPYHVLVVYKSLYCSGSLIASKVVVTAATCLHKYSGDALVKVGSETITGFGQIIPVEDVKIHEYFRHKSELDNDIALMVLKNSVTYGKNVEKVRLIEPETALYEGTSMYVSGWAESNLPTKYANSLILSQMVILERLECEKSHGSLITESNFCANYNYDLRLSDNGGGAIVNDLLVGILSFAPSITEQSQSAIFTNISYFHRWLKKNTLKLLNENCIEADFIIQSLESQNYE